MPTKSKLQNYEISEANKHRCKLPQEEPLLIMYISTGWCVALRRGIRKMTLIDINNRRAKNLYNSVPAINREMDNHMRRHYNMIHPYSKFKALWETFMVVIAIVSLFYYPSLVYTEHDMTSSMGYGYFIINGILFLIFFLDMLVNFNSGYYSNNANKVILDRRQVAMKYLKTWFITDFICLLNVNRLFSASHFFFTLYNGLNILRITMVLRYFPGFTEITQVTFYRVHLTKLIMMTLILVWWATSLLYLLLTMYPESWLKETTKFGKVVACFYRVNYLIFLIGFGEGYSTYDVILLFEIGCWIIGTILKIFCFAEVLQILFKYQSGRNMYHQRIQRLKLRMQKKRLPLQTRSRILQYFDFCYQKNYFKEEDILDCFSEQLKIEVLTYNPNRLLSKVDIFEHIPHQTMDKLCLRMRLVIYLKNDIIVHEGSIGGNMYFIQDGAVAVYTSDGVEICHVNNGEYFGERAMLHPDTKRLATVVAIDACELYQLSHDDFVEVMKPNGQLIKMAEDKLNQKLKGVTFWNKRILYTL